MSRPEPVRVAPLLCLLLLWIGVGVAAGYACWDAVAAVTAVSRPAPPDESSPLVAALAAPLDVLAGVAAFVAAAAGVAGAVLMLGFTWLALPPRERGTLPWLLVLCVTAALVGLALWPPRGWGLVLWCGIPVVVVLEAVRAIVTALLSALAEPGQEMESHAS